MLPAMSGEEIRAWRTALGASQREVADTLGCALRTYRRWECDELQAPQIVSYALAEARRHVVTKRQARERKRRQLRRQYEAKRAAIRAEQRSDEARERHRWKQRELSYRINLRGQRGLEDWTEAQVRARAAEMIADEQEGVTL